MTEQRSIGFLLHPGEQRVIEAAVARAQSCGYGVWTALERPEESIADNGDSAALLVTVGGDGTFLYGARLAAPRGIPVIGVNRGRLGFLNDIEVDDLADAISSFHAGDFRTQRRSLVDVRASDPAGDASALALNEVVVRARGVSVARLRVDVDEELLGVFDADGVVVATATGSTAYALSAGGPPIDPRLHVLCVVPLAPHAVISRPVVVPDAVVVRVTVERGEVFVATDGHSIAQLADGGDITVRPGPELEVVRFAHSPSFQARLREKFRFGVPHKDIELMPPVSETRLERRSVTESRDAS
ncbi:MAG: NAD(+)/NADH kinase [Candidatus Dormibacteraeota bacterium]|nr:NAD(+)/NADH kinase [Candidatus Dormibacteraeota bacterium]MBV9524312.1 NAD(+)/NADH kinase [Candidatus Dormibacteraeota bacterium]